MKSILITALTLLTLLTSCKKEKSDKTKWEGEPTDEDILKQTTALLLPNDANFYYFTGGYTTYFNSNNEVLHTTITGGGGITVYTKLMSYVLTNSVDNYRLGNWQRPAQQFKMAVENGKVVLSFPGTNRHSQIIEVINKTNFTYKSNMTEITGYVTGVRLNPAHHVVYTANFERLSQ